MTEPLTPSDCDLRDFEFMPLLVARLRDSDLATKDPEGCWYAVLLWSASWHQVPAASVPDDDAALARLVGLGRDVKTFRKHKDTALHRFVRCSDGRLYHPVVAERANLAWQEKLEYAPKKAARKAKAKLAADVRWGKQQASGEQCSEHDGGMLDASETDAPSIAASTPLAMPKGRGRGKEIDPEPNGSDADHVVLEIDAGRECWRTAKALIHERDGVSPPKAGEFLGKLLKDHPLVKAPDLYPAVARAAQNGTGDVRGYLTAAAQRITGQRGAPRMNAADLQMRSAIP